MSSSQRSRVPQILVRSSHRHHVPRVQFGRRDLSGVATVRRPVLLSAVRSARRWSKSARVGSSRRRIMLPSWQKHGIPSISFAALRRTREFCSPAWVSRTRPLFQARLLRRLPRHWAAPASPLALIWTSLMLPGPSLQDGAMDQRRSTPGMTITMQATREGELTSMSAVLYQMRWTLGRKYKRHSG